MPNKFSNTHFGKYLDSRNGFDIIECESCGFRHVTPLPTKEELERIYRHEYYCDDKPQYISHFQEDIDWWNIAYSDRYDTFEEILNNDQRRILDIGSGPGYFLKHGMERGWNGLGIEPSLQASNHAKDLGLEIIQEFLDSKLVSQIGKFDVVHMSEVLEHIPDPKEMLENAFNLLNPGGILCVVLPNDYNPFQLALRKASNIAPYWVAPPHHLNYFDFNSLENLMKKNGFTHITSESTFPIDSFLLMGENYVGDDIKGRECHLKRMIFETTLNKADMNPLKRQMFRDFAKLGIGREACVYGQRNTN